MYSLDNSIINKLKEIENDRVKREKFFRNECKFWICFGKFENVIRSIELAIKLKGFTYWGVRTEDLENIIEKLEHQQGGALGNYKSLIRKFFDSRGRGGKYNIAFLCFSENKKYVAAGIITALEFSKHDIIWYDEEEKGKTIYPFRFRMFLIWLHEAYLKTIFENSLEDLYKVRDGVTLEYNVPPAAPGLHPVADDKSSTFADFLIENFNPIFIKENIESKCAISRKNLVRYEEFRNDESSSSNYASFVDFVSRFFIFDKSDEHILREIELCAEDGKCAMLLRGPPGSGKTELVRLLSKYLRYDLIEISCHQFTTRCDLIGDFVLNGNRIVYKPGALIRALSMIGSGSKGVIILLDEINRTDFDKIASELMMILGSLDWKIPESLIVQLEEAIRYENDSDNNITYIVRKALEVLEYCNNRLPNNIIFAATMNSFDTAALFRLGYATLRRFRVIDVVWSKDTIRLLVNNLTKDLQDKGINVREIFDDILNSIDGIESILQPGIMINFVNILKRLINRGIDSKQAFQIAVRETIIHQLDILEDKSLNKLLEVFNKYGINISGILPKTASIAVPW